MEKTINDYKDLPRITVIGAYEIHTGIVVGQDEDIGITIINEADPEDFILCFRTPMMMSKLYPNRYIPSPEKDAQAKETYAYLSACISEGRITLRDPNRPDAGGGASTDTCAFSQ